jgi:site-specific recombinase XerC
MRIDQSVSPLVGVVDPKTDASATCVWMPQSIATELDFWMESRKDTRPEAFIFASRKGTPLSANNFLKRARDTSVMWFAGFDFHAQHPPALDYFLQQRG